MTLNHINLGVTDIPATVEMFETHFGLHRPQGFPFNPAMAFLNDDSGNLISLFKVKDTIYPKIFHIGFMQQNRQPEHRSGKKNPHEDEPRQYQSLLLLISNHQKLCFSILTTLP